MNDISGEDKLFQILKQTPIAEMVEMYSQTSLKINNTSIDDVQYIDIMDKFLEQHGWNYSDFSNARKYYYMSGKKYNG